MSAEIALNAVAVLVGEISFQFSEVTHHIAALRNRRHVGMRPLGTQTDPLSCILT